MHLCIYFPFIVKDVIIVIIIIIINLLLFFNFILIFFLTENIEKGNIDPHCNRFDLHFI